MASSSGTTASSGSLLQNSGSEEELQQVIMDQRKRKRMISNRESARRSRMRKQQQLDDLMAEVSHLRKVNNDIVNNLTFTTQTCLNLEAENIVLRAQMAELTNRLESLNEIISFLDAGNGCFGIEEPNYNAADVFMFHMNNPMNHMYVNQQHIMATAEMLHY